MRPLVPHCMTRFPKAAVRWHWDHFQTNNIFFSEKSNLRKKHQLFGNIKTELDAKSFSALHVVQLSVREATRWRCCRLFTRLTLRHVAPPIFRPAILQKHQLSLGSKLCHTLSIREALFQLVNCPTRWSYFIISLFIISLFLWFWYWSSIFHIPDNKEI